jgi:hypothetical protein
VVPKKGMSIRQLMELSRECGATVSVTNRSGDIRVRFLNGETLRFHHSLKDATGRHASILRRQIGLRATGDGEGPRTPAR